MPMFRKKPVTIEARQLPVAVENADDRSAAAMGWLEIMGWCPCTFTKDALGPCLLIDTLEGTMRANPGDWIIKGVQGEFYPCKPDIFAATYEAAE